MAYDRWYHKSVSALSVELDRFKCHGPLGRYGHFVNVVNHLRCFGLPFDWNPWAELLTKEFCEGHRDIVVTGATACSKSTSAAMYAFVWWMCDYKQSLVAITSTSRIMAQKRIWSWIRRFKTAIPALPGNLVNSAAELESEKGDRQHSMCIVPGSAEKEQEGLGKLKGWHAPRVLIIADELQDMTEEVINGCVNMMAGTREAQFIGLGNATSILDTHGQACEPLNGWGSISDQDDFWETKNGICIHLDGRKSPNIPEMKYEGLFSQRTIDSTKARFGEDSLHWHSMVCGFWPPEGAQADRVMSTSLIIKTKSFDKAVWKESTIWIAGLDPAYGGDKCILQFARYGQSVDGLWTVEFAAPVMVPTKVTLLNKPVEEQIVEFVIAECKKRGMNPEDLAVDSTGQGKAILRLLIRDWGNVQSEEFGGLASENPISSTNHKKAKEEYCSKVSELWYTARRFVESGCVRGLPKEAAKDFTVRTFSLVGNPKRILIESKSDCKLRLKHSPDHGDAASLVFAVARSKGGLSKSEERPKNNDTWNNSVKKYHRVYSSQYAYT